MNGTSKVCLPDLLDTADTYHGDTCYVAGWGRIKYRGPQPETLLEVKVDLATEEQCTSYMATHHTFDYDDCKGECL